MKTLLTVLLGTLCLSASAQWYRVDLLLEKHVRAPEPLGPLANHSISRLPKFKVNCPPIIKEQLSVSDYSLQAKEAIVMKTAQHNMRFRVYNDASYNFSELAKMYIQQNRYAEAKWYLLQSNFISREQNNDKHTIANLLDLVIIKVGLGDFIQAQQDLTEAHTMAILHGFKDDLVTVDKETRFLKQSQLNPVKVDVKYAEAPATITAKAE